MYLNLVHPGNFRVSLQEHAQVTPVLFRNAEQLLVAAWGYQLLQYPQITCLLASLQGYSAYLTAYTSGRVHLQTRLLETERGIQECDASAMKPQRESREQAVGEEEQIEKRGKKGSGYGDKYMKRKHEGKRSRKIPGRSEEAA